MAARNRPRLLVLLAALLAASLVPTRVAARGRKAGPTGEPFLLCDMNQRFSEGHGTVEAYNLALKHYGIVEPDLVPKEGVGSSVYWWADPEPHRSATGVHWDRCFTIFSHFQERDYIDFHNQLTLISIKMGSVRLAHYNREGLSCRTIDADGSAICKAAPGREKWSRLISEGETFVHNSSVPHSVAFLTPYVLRTVCFLETGDM